MQTSLQSRGVIWAATPLINFNLIKAVIVLPRHAVKIFQYKMEPEDVKPRISRMRPQEKKLKDSETVSVNDSLTKNRNLALNQ